VKIGEVRTPPAARTRTNGQRRDGVAMCVLRSEEDRAREGEGGGRSGGALGGFSRRNKV
jgi:hypothetical protein